ncbi:hypothetical protein PsorP6_004249 [Peronosclerospora sorghi]|uniref:Uncharacterized protein n=1 Tax=Peronosclerospora sorghi TaxID=230839 RepID=A0ACC0VL74_9STRA|nr:hypothetical protein PsorP6_004249 [Peronosclerospora sorghi]
MDWRDHKLDSLPTTLVSGRFRPSRRVSADTAAEAEDTTPTSIDDDVSSHASQCTTVRRLRKAREEEERDNEDAEIEEDREATETADLGGSMVTESLDRYLPAIAESLDGHDEHKALRLVHRLDKETSGLLVLSRSRLAAAKFSTLFNVLSSTSRTKRSSRRQRHHLCTRT